MSQTNLNTFEACFDRIHGMLLDFVDRCPEDIWKSTFGGFPVWQQAYHTFACYDFFTRGKEADAKSFLFGDKELPVVFFKENPEAPSKDEVRKMAEDAKAMVDDFFAELKSDEKLTDQHEGISARVKADMSNLAMITTMIGHGYYHLGGCDAALREAGLPGIF